MGKSLMSSGGMYALYLLRGEEQNARKLLFFCIHTNFWIPCGCTRWGVIGGDLIEGWADISPARIHGLVFDR